MSTAFAATIETRDKKKENLEWEAEWDSSDDDDAEGRRDNSKYESIPSEEEKRVEALMSKTERYKNILKSNNRGSSTQSKSGFLWENVSNQRDAMMCMLSSPDYPIESQAYLYAPEDDNVATANGDSIFVAWFKSIAECCLPFCSPHMYTLNKNKRP